MSSEILRTTTTEKVWYSVRESSLSGPTVAVSGMWDDPDVATIHADEIEQDSAFDKVQIVKVTTTTTIIEEIVPR